MEQNSGAEIVIITQNRQELQNLKLGFNKVRLKLPCECDFLYAKVTNAWLCKNKVGNNLVLNLLMTRQLIDLLLKEKVRLKEGFGERLRLRLMDQVLTDQEKEFSKMLERLYRSDWCGENENNTL